MQPRIEDMLLTPKRTEAVEEDEFIQRAKFRERAHTRHAQRSRAVSLGEEEG